MKPDARDSGQRLDPSDSQEEIPLIALVNVLLENLTLVVGVPLVLFAIVAIWSFLAPRSYRAESQFTTESSDATNGAAGLAMQLGLSVRSGGSESLDFYIELLETRDLLRALATTPFSISTESESAQQQPLTDILVDDSEGPDRRLREAIDLLREMIETESNARAGIITLKTEAPTPALAVQINRRLLELLNEFNIERRQTRARMEREFVEQRLGEANSELATAETELQHFMEQNRDFQSSPQLQFEASRLERNLQLRQSLQRSLMESYESARVAEIRESPVLTVLDWPEGSARPAGRGLVLRGLAALFLGTLLGVGLAFGRAYATRQRERNPEQYERFDNLRRAALHRLVPSRFRKGQGASRISESPDGSGSGSGRLR